ncbi:hypothetical protein ALI144C_26105 [Actinosynnema sp. ALI-1.44]|nr:hypothetical protein ALI144C_26105 [Actinosynnema sp. ALI-1.44]
MSAEWTPTSWGTAGHVQQVVELLSHHCGSADWPPQHLFLDNTPQFGRAFVADDDILPTHPQGHASLDVNSMGD